MCVVKLQIQKLWAVCLRFYLRLSSDREFNFVCNVAKQTGREMNGYDETALLYYFLCSEIYRLWRCSSISRMCARRQLSERHHVQPHFRVCFAL